MKNYIFSVVAVSIVGMIAEMIIPEGKIKKYAGFAVAVILSVCIIQPITQLKSGFIENYGIEYTEPDYTSAVTDTVRSVSGFEDAAVSVETEQGEVCAIYITVPHKKLAERAQNALTEEYLRNFLSAVYGTENIYIGDG